MYVIKISTKQGNEEVLPVFDYRFVFVATWSGFCKVVRGWGGSLDVSYNESLVKRLRMSGGVSNEPARALLI